MESIVVPSAEIKISLSKLAGTFSAKELKAYFKKAQKNIRTEYLVHFLMVE